MRTIREVWEKNLKDLIGEKPLKEISAGSKVPYRSLQNMLNGTIAYGLNLKRLAEYFGVPETTLFFDSDLAAKAPAMTPQKALDVLASAIEAPKRRLAEIPKDSTLNKYPAPFLAKLAEASYSELHTICVALGHIDARELGFPHDFSELIAPSEKKPKVGRNIPE